ncbi:hypothetical protein ACVMYR_28260 [Micromonospora sp. PTRAS2]
MTDQQPFTAQPYPLFYAQLDDDTIRSGRVLGWINVHLPAEAQPVVLLNNPDGSIDRVVYVEHDIVQFSWIRDTLNEAVAAAEKKLVEGHPAAPGKQPTIDAVRRAWPEVVSRLQRNNRRVAALAQSAQVDEMTVDGIMLSTASAVVVKMINDHAGPISEAVYEILGIRCGVHARVRAKSID